MKIIYLYVKTHNKTGLKYFGKTTKKNPHKYKGSGLYWQRHLKKHGEDFQTEIVAEFQDENSCQEFALNFSKEHDIANSPDWANLQEENGLDGAPVNHKGHKFTSEQLKKLSESSREKWKDPEFRKKMSEARSKSWTEERKRKQSERLTGVKRPEHSELMKSRPVPDGFHRSYNMSEKHKNKISKALRGKGKSEEHRQKLQEATQNRTPEEWELIKQKRRSNLPPKFEIDGVSYTSYKEASEELGISPYKVRKLISRHLR